MTVKRVFAHEIDVVSQLACSGDHGGVGTDDGEVIRVGLRCRTVRAGYPGCGSWSGRVHDSYLRFPAGLPVVGRRVMLQLRVRRFTCEERFVRAADVC
ncbi:transposase family protein [Streptomyces sp. NPDC058274]|uniref:transposase family protein n=1 Tax=Streptomyces sp. NPDC058274 TaxID=3346416 RepID=UPI0036EAB28C